MKAPPPASGARARRGPGAARPNVNSSARDEPASATVRASPALATAKSSGCWFMKRRALAGGYSGASRARSRARGGQRAEGGAGVPAGEHAAIAAEERAGEGRGGALPVGAGDADERDRGE